MLYRRRTLVWAGGSLRVVVLWESRARRLGLRDPVVRSCAFVARSVHSFGLDRPIGVVWVSLDGVVRKKTRLKPNRVVIGPTGSVIESRDLAVLPPVGAVITALP